MATRSLATSYAGLNLLPEVGDRVTTSAGRVPWIVKAVRPSGVIVLRRESGWTGIRKIERYVTADQIWPAPARALAS